MRLEVHAARDLGLYRTLPLLERYAFQNRVLPENSFVSEAADDVSEFEDEYWNIHLEPLRNRQPL